MIRLFNLYIPTRSILLFVGELAAVCACFSLAILVRFGGAASSAELISRYANWRIPLLAALALICSHFTEVGELRKGTPIHQSYAKVFMMVGLLSLVLGVLVLLFPTLSVGREAFLIGVCFLPLGYMGLWWLYQRVISCRALRERVYLIGNGERAKRIAAAINDRQELGMDIIGWAGMTSSRINGQALGAILRDLEDSRGVDRVIVALTDRRSVMPVSELLDLRLQGITVDDGTSLIERISGKIEVDELNPSWIIFGEGFRFGPVHSLLRRSLSVALALTLSILTLPFVPIIALLIRLGSRGPILYRQERVGMHGRTFMCLKFRTMRPNAEADTGPTWASNDDPRITKFGSFLRRSRLDEIPQLWNVLKGDMAFVGPRPERPEFVQKLQEDIPYYAVRHVARPGMTGWAQVNYGYGASVEDSKEKLRYDLYYIRNASVLLDLIIVFRTFRAVLVGRGVR